MLALVSRREPGTQLSLENQGDGQFTALAGRWSQLTPPLRELTTMAWLAVCRSVEEAFPYRYLAELSELP